MVKGKCSICKSLCKNKLYFWGLTLKFLLGVTIKPSVLSPTVIFHDRQNKNNNLIKREGDKSACRGRNLYPKGSLFSFTVYCLEISLIEIQLMYVVAF